eukprot:CAMPEP_0168287346 /NCGR_PEP_ID=MMETSP0142_2-20121227/2159_1 /TAXON_ID=44445 /ORGANISM="Pseudo-nitzschia australis, Strain 10249 10 AB" /LENGTH=61 /DNA_ID=CAMNT_0008232661 /DNA_START=102 /DNA_END=284 /DNA_ORIENTATION=-
MTLFRHDDDNDVGVGMDDGGGGGLLPFDEEPRQQRQRVCEQRPVGDRPLTSHVLQQQEQPQ